MEQNKIDMIKLNNSGVVFDKAAHTYKYNGKKLKGITGRINEYLDTIFTDIDSLPEYVQERIEEARIYGDGVHNAIEDDFKGEMPDLDFLEELEDYKRLCRKNNLKMIASEYTVTDGMKYASCIDGVFIDSDNNIFLGDFKTPKQDKREYNTIQLSIYKHFFELVNPHLEVKGGVIFRINRRGDVINELYCVDFKDTEEVSSILYSGDTKKGLQEAKTDQLPANIDTLMCNLASVQSKINKYKDIEKEFRAKLEKAFEDYGVEKLENDYITISKRDGYVRKGFDKKGFEKEYPDLAKQFETETEVKPSITIKLK
mgnify:CR=1 FL=1